MNIRSTDTLSVVTSAAVATDVYVAYAETAMGTQMRPAQLKSVNTAITTATTTTILAGPSAPADYQWLGREVKTIAIRNKGASSQTVTVRHSDGTTTVELTKATLAAGAELHYDAGVGWVASSGVATGASLITATANTVNSAADTLADVAGLTFAVEAGDKYRFRAVCHYSADATTSGSRWTINGPAATAASTGYASRYSLTATTETVNHGLAAVQLPAAANATSAATTGNIAIVEGYYTPSTAGTLAVQFAAEAGTITALAGSTLEVMKVIDA